MAIQAFKDAIGQTPVDKSAASFIFGPGLLAVFCAPLLSLLLVSMISVAGPIASAIALGIVAGGIMSAANARAVYDIIARMPLAPAQPVQIGKVTACIAVVCLTMAGAGLLVLSARESALHHIRASIALIKSDLETSQETYIRRLAHEREILSREKDRVKAGHASQADIDIIKTRLGALETEAHRAITASKRDLEDLTAKQLALSSIAPALGAR
jgi:NACalpha-BTF3-like transcription factor